MKLTKHRAGQITYRTNLYSKMNLYSTNATLIKFICALSVIVSHSFCIAQGQKDILEIATNGQMGAFVVGIFFVFSGLYVAKSLEKSNDSKKYYKKRVLSIFPPLILVVVLSIIILGFLASSLSPATYFINPDTYKYLLNCALVPIHNLPGVFENNIFGQTVNGALWTLTIEFLCYIWLWFTWIFAKKINIKLLKLFHFITIISSLFLYFYFILVSNMLFAAFVRAELLFFVGVVFYDYKNKLVLNIKICILLVLVLFISVFTPVFQYVYILTLPYITISLALGLPQLPNNIFIKKICMLFYEIYLVAFPIQQFVTYVFGGQMSIPQNFIISIPVAILLAFVIHCVLNLFSRNRIQLIPVKRYSLLL